MCFAQAKCRGFLHFSHCALSSLHPPHNVVLSAERSECIAAPVPLLHLGCAAASLQSLFLVPRPRLSSAPSQPNSPASCWPLEGSTRHCHGCGILTGSKWIKQILSVTGIQCGENMFPGGPQPFLGKRQIVVNNASLGSKCWRSRTQPVHTWYKNAIHYVSCFSICFFFFLDNGAMIKEIFPERGHLKIKGSF